ncbi:MAG TPA: HAD family hydrolase [Candidatus Sulfomarinibacteraceae bacterium]|nr:HAD family hydrolase [Candidatus Sulfomarinibacteraceae bacterium]
MRYIALATDYDGTLAPHGKVSPDTVQALERLRQSGRKLLLITGRRVDSLLDVFPEIGLFDLVVAENGAVLYDPQTEQTHALHEPPAPELIQFLEEQGASPLAVGAVIVATREPYRQTVLAGLQKLGLKRNVILNKGAVMVLPAGVDKRSGLAAALKRLGLSPQRIVAIGDAENDQSLLEYCDLGVAVQDALPSLKKRADYVTSGGAGAGVVELIEILLEDDLQMLQASCDNQSMPAETPDEG